MKPACGVDGMMADSGAKRRPGDSGPGPAAEAGEHGGETVSVPENNEVPCTGGFVAVHVGAGYHSPANSDLYKNICRQACLQAVSLLRQKKSALEVMKTAMIALEDSPWTNAGTGSNLTVKGTVECDASIMDGKSLQFGAVGAVAGVKNPILVAENLLQTQLQGNMSLGRIPPSLLVGNGAHDWAVRHNIPTIKSEALVTDSSHKAFTKHKRKLDMLEEGSSHRSAKVRRIESTSPQVNGTDGTMDSKVTDSPCTIHLGDPLSSSLTETEEECSSADDRLLDTVGAVCVDHQGRVVSAVSSGGIVLKQPGRLGQAALYGCGCWAENGLRDEPGVGVSTSGCGEHLTKAFMARECADGLRQTTDNPTTALHQTFLSKFLGSPFLRTVDQKLGGCLAVRSDRISPSELQLEVLWAHTTDSMCLAYMSTSDNHPKALVSRLPEGSKCGKSCVVQSKRLTIPANSLH